MTLAVAAKPSAPQGTSATIAIDEDQAYPLTQNDFGFSDPNDTPPNSFDSVKISSLPGVGTLTLAGNPVFAGNFISVADLNAGLLVYTPPANVNGASVAGASFQFQVRDNGGVANGGTDLDPTPRTLNFSLRKLNDAPAGADKTVQILEDATYPFTTIDFGFSDPADASVGQGDNLKSVIITSTPTKGSLLLNGTTTVTTGRELTLAEIAQLTYKPAADGSGNNYASFTFQVKDTGGTPGIDTDQSPNTFTINVTPVSDPPTGQTTTVTGTESVTYTFTSADFNFSDANDNPANSFINVNIATVTLQGGTLTNNGSPVGANSVVSVSSINLGQLRYTPAAGANGTKTNIFTFKVQDDGGTALTGQDTDQTAKTMSISLASANSAPAGADFTAVHSGRCGVHILTGRFHG